MPDDDMPAEYADRVGRLLAEDIREQQERGPETIDDEGAS